MSTISAGDLIKLRQQKHKSTVYLNVLKPATILAARVNGSFTRGARSIDYDGGSGTYALIRSYQELWVGTAAGLKNVGRVKIVSISGAAVSGTIALAENAIVWVDDLYLTIKHDYPIHPEQPRIDSNGVFYKRYSTAYTDGNSQPSPVCVAGPDQAKRLPATATINAQVVTGADDGHIFGASFNAAANPIFFGNNTGQTYKGWFRFGAAAIPQGATILTAYLELVGGAASGGNNVKVRLTAEDTDNPTAPTDTVDFNARTRTTAAVDWNITDTWTPGAAVQSPSLVTIVQEVVDRADFSPGNAVQLFYADNGSTVSHTRSAVAYEGTPANAAILHVVYTESAPVSAVFNIDLSDSYAVADGATIPASGAYALTVAPSADATVSFDADAGTGTVTCTTQSSWWLTASVTDSNGKSQERFIWITTEAPYRNFTISGWSETFGQGVRCQVNVHGDVTQSDFPDGALCILSYDNEFNGVSDYVNILASDYDNVLTVGYIRNENSADNLNDGSHEVSFDITTIDDLLSNVPMASLSIEAVATPAYWYQYARWLTVGRAIHHLLLWHSDVLHRIDYIGGTSNTLRLKEAKFEEGTLFQQANRLAYDQGILARFTADRLNRLHLVADSQMLNTAARAALDTVFTIDEADVSQQISYTRNTEARTYISQLSGFYFDGANSTPYVSLIPGYQESGDSFSVPDRRGSGMQNVTGQVLASQADANEKCGRIHADKNREIEQFGVPFRGNYIGALSTIPSYGWYGLGIDNTTLARQLSINGIKLLCRQINLSYTPGDISVEASFEPEATGPDAIPGNYPTTLPAAPDPPAPNWEADGLPALLAFSSASYRDDDDTDWEELQAASYLCGGIDPWWKVKQRSTNPVDVIWWAAAAGKVWRIKGKDGTPQELTPITAPPNTHSDAAAPTVAGLTPVQYLGDPWVEDRHFILWQWQESNSGNSYFRGWVSYTNNDGLSWSWMALYDGLTLPTQIKPVWMAVNGSSILVTAWIDTGTDVLRLLVFDAVIPAYADEFSLGACSLAELTAKTYYAFPVTVLDDDSTWYVAGRMNAPQSLANPEHIIKTANAGTAWSSVDKAHGTKYVATLEVGLLSGGNRSFYLVVGGS